MRKENLSPESIKQVLRDYSQQYKQYPFLTLVAIFLPGIGSIFVFFIPPLIIEQIVNAVSQNTAISVSSLWVYIALFGGLWFLGEMCWRIGMYALTKLETSALKNLADSAFSRLMERDYDFYANNFVGSLTKKCWHS